MASLVAAHPAASAPGPGGQPAGDPAGHDPAAGDLAAGGDWSGPGGIDDDEHLAAYNAFLARLNESGPGGRR